jgi:hypothetical protein
MYSHPVQCGGAGRDLVALLLAYISWRGHFTFDRDSEFSLRKKRATKLMARLSYKIGTYGVENAASNNFIVGAYSLSRTLV